MRPKSMMLIMIALGCGLIAAFAAFQVVGSQNGQQQVEMVKVFVAMSEIDIDDAFDSSNVKLEEWPQDRVPEGAITDLAKLEGKYAAQRLYEGELILERKVLDPNQRTTATLQIPDGYRVCTVKVEVDTANNGLLNPGDRVDVMVFLRKSAEVPTTGIRHLLRDVRVFAVNSETERVYDKEGNKINAKTVSFLVKPEQSAKLLLASQLGVLQLSLRRPDQSDEELQTTDMTLDAILNGVADKADEDKSDGEPLTAVEPTTVVEPDPPAPVVLPKPEFEMEIIYPEGNQRFSWMDKNKLPTLAEDGTESFAQPVQPDQDDSLDLPEFDDDDGSSEMGDGEDWPSEPAE